MDVVLLCRVSTAGQDYSRQVDELTDFCSRMGWNVRRIFTAKVSGAKKIEERSELTEMLDYIRDNRIDKVCVLRYSDLLTLEWRHIDFASRTLTKTVYKTKRSISLPLVDKAVEILHRWRKTGGNNRFVFNLLDEGFDLSDTIKLNNARLTKNRNIQQSLRSVGIKMGFKFSLTIHVARHTFAVQALRNGMDVHTISHLMGHSSSLVTEKVYAEFLPDTINTTIRGQLERNVIEYSSS